MGNPKQWGGKRPNSGRKPSPIPHKRINVYLAITDLAYLKSLAASPSQAIRRLIQDRNKEQMK